MQDLTTETISREAALRIALATKELPDATPAALLSVLHGKLDPPLSLDKLANITVTDLLHGFNRDDEENPMERSALEKYKSAVRVLWGELDEDANLPMPSAYAEGDLPDSIRIAVSSNTGDLVDGHFGSCLRFLVYQVSPSEARLIDVRSTIDTDLTEDKIWARAELIADCDLLFAVSIGGPAAAKVGRHGIHPMKTKSGPLRAATGDSALSLVEKLCPIVSEPPPWLAKALGASPEERLKNYDGSSDDV